MSNLELWECFHLFQDAKPFSRTVLNKDYNFIELNPKKKKKKKTSGY